MTSKQKEIVQGTGIIIGASTLIVIFTILLIKGFGILDRKLYPYQYEATYCNVNKSKCAYREKDSKHRECPEYWDRSGAFAVADNFKLVEDTCKVEER